MLGLEVSLNPHPQPPAPPRAAAWEGQTGLSASETDGPAIIWGRGRIPSLGPDCGERQPTAPYVHPRVSSAQPYDLRLHPRPPTPSAPTLPMPPTFGSQRLSSQSRAFLSQQGAWCCTETHRVWGVGVLGLRPPWEWGLPAWHRPPGATSSQEVGRGFGALSAPCPREKLVRGRTGRGHLCPSVRAQGS